MVVLEDFTRMFSGAPLEKLSFLYEQLAALPKDWRETFRVFPRIRELAWGGAGISDVLLPALSTLTPRSSSNDSEPEPEIVLPNLRSLALRNVVYGPEVLAQVQSCLDARARAGAPKLEMLWIEIYQMPRIRMKNTVASRTLERSIAALRERTDSLIFISM
ncbi:hypothetical protein C8Q76DRAFT_738504 [Earliella scabrosa]|nr:hypothetical protein C8Q76DRAFT_738504 [Earliella scabrosa]